MNEPKRTILQRMLGDFAYWMLVDMVDDKGLIVWSDRVNHPPRWVRTGFGSHRILTDSIVTLLISQGWLDAETLKVTENGRALLAVDRPTKEQ